MKVTNSVDLLVRKHIREVFNLVPTWHTVYVMTPSLQHTEDSDIVFDVTLRVKTKNWTKKMNLKYHCEFFGVPLRVHPTLLFWRLSVVVNGRYSHSGNLRWLSKVGSSPSVYWCRDRLYTEEYSLRINLDGSVRRRFKDWVSLTFYIMYTTIAMTIRWM